jgi:hypothetical protein
MTYKELLEILNQMNEDQLNCDVTVYVASDHEFYRAENIYEVNGSDVVDDGQFVIKY